MTTEFKKQFDALQNIELAALLAYDLGYFECYLDGDTINSPTYDDEMRTKISTLCGNPTSWPKKVMDAYSEGCHDGFMDT